MFTKTLTIVAFSAFSLSACSGPNSLPQKMGLWKVGVVERDWERIDQPKRVPLDQPTKASLIRDASREAAEIESDWVSDDWFKKDRYDSKKEYTDRIHFRNSDNETSYRTPL